jgi:hypothetical protein
MDVHIRRIKVSTAAYELLLTIKYWQGCFLPRSKTCRNSHLFVILAFDWSECASSYENIGSQKIHLPKIFAHTPHPTYSLVTITGRIPMLKHPWVRGPEEGKKFIQQQLAGQETTSSTTELVDPLLEVNWSIYASNKKISSSPLSKRPDEQGMKIIFCLPCE